MSRTFAETWPRDGREIRSRLFAAAAAARRARASHRAQTWALTRLGTFRARGGSLAIELVGLAFSEDVATRFIGYGWNVWRVGDANDLQMLARAFEVFQKTTDRPTLILVDSHIG